MDVSRLRGEQVHNIESVLILPLVIFPIFRYIIFAILETGNQKKYIYIFYILVLGIHIE